MVISPKNKSQSQAGFTIVELMIATLVFSMVLLVITFGVIHFTSSYYKGINSSNTQTTTQGAIDNITQAIQFSAGGTDPGGTSGSDAYFCAGNLLYLYTPGLVYSGGTPAAGAWGLYAITNPYVGNCTDSGLTAAQLAGGKELLGKNMRVTGISLVQGADPMLWMVSIGIAFGDPDLLCNNDLSSGTGACDDSQPSYDATTPVVGDDVRCKATIGAQFCSVATIQAMVQQRSTTDG